VGVCAGISLARPGDGGDDDNLDHSVDAGPALERGMGMGTAMGIGERLPLLSRLVVSGLELRLEPDSELECESDSTGTGIVAAAAASGIDSRLDSRDILAGDADSNAVFAASADGCGDDAAPQGQYNDAFSLSFSAPSLSPLATPKEENGPTVFVGGTNDTPGGDVLAANAAPSLAPRLMPTLPTLLPIPPPFVEKDGATVRVAGNAWGLCRAQPRRGVDGTRSR
jgi:hypothetical protein